MRKFRFNIASLLTVILVLGVSFAALRQSTDLWESGLFTATLGILLISILLAIHRTESKRAFWIGFALFGTIYLGLTLMPSIERRLITTKALATLGLKLSWSTGGLVYFDYDSDGTADLYVANTFGDVAAAAGLQPAGKKAWFQDFVVGASLTGSGTTENFVRIGHSLFALLVGCLGGQLSRRLGRYSRVPGPVAAVDSSPSDR